VHGMFYDDPRAAGGPGMSVRTGRAAVGKDGVARVRVGCSEETAAFCRGTLRLTQGRRSLGSGRFGLRAGTSARVAVKVSIGMAARPAQGGVLKARATATGLDLFGHKNTVSRTILLRSSR